MRSRWARFFSNRSSIAAFALLGLLAPSGAHATLSIRSLQSTGTNDKFYFAANQSGGALTPFGTSAAPAFLDPDTKYHFRVLKYDKTVRCGGGSCDLTAGIEFGVSSDKATIPN